MSPESTALWRGRWHDLKARLFHYFPHAWVSAVVYWLARIETPVVKNFLNRRFAAFFALRMEDAECEDPQAYPTLDALFVRAIKPALRPWPASPGMLAAPCDSRISQLGSLDGDGRIVQAKSQSFTAEELLGDAAPEYRSGQFATLYLSPDACHRVYMPTAGRLLEMRHIPGRQFTVAAYAAERIPRLYARNERVACLFEDPNGVRFAVVMVGALNVASIELSWCGLVAPRRRAVSRWRYAEFGNPEVRLNQGAELGRFHLGSTVVLLSAHPDMIWNPAAEPGETLLYGQPLLLPAS